MTTTEYDSEGNVVNYATHFENKIVCQNSIGNVSEDASDCEKSEIADRNFEEFFQILELKYAIDRGDSVKIRSLFSKASKLGFAAGIEHERSEHSCKGRAGSFFG